MDSKRKKRLSSTVLVLGFFVLGFAFNIHQVKAQEQNLFSDVREGNRYFLALQFLKNHDIIQGYEDGTFHPDKDINRAEALNMLLKVFSKEPIQHEKKFNFPDVNEGDWFYNIVEEAFANGIINGYPDQKFHPERTLNRAEALKISLLQENDELPTVTEKPYSDVTLEDWFAPYAEVSKIRQLILESRSNGGELLSAQSMSRGEFAELIYRLLQSRNGWHFGRATFYADSLAGRGTSSGESYNPQVFTTAHKTLPFGTKLLVKNAANGKEVIVTVNDRGPYATGIELDLSKSAFSELASPSTGIIRTEYMILNE